MNNRGLEAGEADKPDDCDALVGQLEINLKSESQQGVVIKLPVKWVVLSTHLKVPRLASLEYEGINHGNNDGNKKDRVNTKCLGKIVFLFDEFWIFADLTQWLLEMILSIDSILIEVPYHVCLKTSRHRIVKAFESHFSVGGPFDEPADIGQDLDGIHELPDRFSHCSETKSDNDENYYESVRHRGDKVAWST